MSPDVGPLFTGLHHMQLAMPRGEEEAARGFFAGVLGLSESTSRRCSPHGVAPGSAAVGWSCTSGELTGDGDFPGFRRIYAHDPFGNRLEFLERA